MATATRSKPRASAKQSTGVTPADFERVVSWLSTEVLVERAAELRVAIRGLIAGVNVHLIGVPGIAKSLLWRELAKCIVDSIYFEKQVHGLMPADALIGAYDPKKFLETGELVRNVEGKLPASHIGFVDEITRGNGPSHDALLSITNVGERQYEHNGVLAVAALRVFISASNTWFDPDNQQAQALSDRVTLMLWIEDIKSDENFKELIRRGVRRRHGVERTARETITLAQLDEAQALAREVDVERAEFLDKLAELRRKTKAEGLIISPRRWQELVYVCQANAWMAGRDHCIPEDLVIVEHGLWRDQEDRAIAHKLVLEFHGRYEREAAKFKQEAAKPFADVEAIKPEVEGTPPNEELDPDVLRKAISASRAIDAVKARVDAVLREADGEKRDAASLRELSNDLLSQQKWFSTNGLPTGLGKQTA
ncbi:MAG TPA: MoxR family ATPase [Vicinamibacterales bacterium]